MTNTELPKPTFLGHGGNPNCGGNGPHAPGEVRVLPMPGAVTVTLRQTFAIRSRSGRT